MPDIDLDALEAALAFAKTADERRADGDDATATVIEAAPALIAAARRARELEAENAKWRAAVMSVVAATRAYLPPDGIDTQECLNRILEATDNREINSLILEEDDGGN